MFLDSFNLFNCDESANELEFLLNSSTQITVLPNVEKLVKDSQSLEEYYRQSSSTIRGNNLYYHH